MLFQHPVNRGETHASTLAGIFGRKKWLKNSTNRSRIHSITGIFHRQADVRTKLRFGIAVPRRFVDFDSRGREGQLAAVGHGIARIQRKIHDDLFDIAGISENRRQIGSQLHIKGDVLADESPQHRNRLLNNLIERERSPLDDLLSAVGEKLAGQSRSAFRRALHLMKEDA